MTAPVRRLVQRLPSGRHGLPREVVVQSQRERIIDAMISAVADEGFRATSVADVIARAGVSRATFYEQFKDKDDCFLASYEAVVELLLEHVNRAYRQPAPWPGKMRAGLEALLGGLAAQPDAARVAIVEVIAAGPRAHRHYLDAIDAFLPFLEEGRGQIPHGGELPASIPRIVANGAAGIIFEEVVAGRATGLPRLLPELVYSALAPYLGHEAALKELRQTPRPKR